MTGMVAGVLGVAAAAGATFAGLHTMVPWSQLYGENFNGLKDGTRALALTYDDGPNDPWTPRLLDVLAKHEVRATFFMLGKYVKQRPDLAKMVAQAGHTIGNHSFSHPNIIFASENELRRQIEETNKVIEDATGEKPFLFRPPFGGRRPGQFGIVRELKMQPVMWRVTCYDWSAKDAASIVRNADRQIAGGEIILLHDGGHLRMGEDRSRSVEATDQILTKYKDRFQFVTVTDMLRARPGVNVPFV